MSTNVIKPRLPQDRTLGAIENWKEAAEAAFGLLAVGAFISVLLGTSFLFVGGATYLNSLVGSSSLPFLGQFFGP
jgi:uncharacterized oligopeptide transporter (OPT) family protein